jgi:hypothetical protein
MIEVQMLADKGFIFRRIFDLVWMLQLTYQSVEMIEFSVLIGCSPWISIILTSLGGPKGDIVG